MRQKPSSDLRLHFVRSPPSDEVPVMVCCQEHDDSNPSLAVYKDNLHCFGCGFHIQGAKKAEEYLSRFTILLDNKHHTISRKKSIDALNPALADLYCNFLFLHKGGEKVGFFRSRHITDETIRKFRLGYDGFHYTIPIFQGTENNRILLNFRYRRDDDADNEESAKYFGRFGRNDVVLFSWLHHNQDLRQYRVVVESELDVVLLQQNNVPAICITNGVSNLPKILDHLDSSLIRTLHIAVDVDEAGMNAYKRLQLLNQDRFKIVPVCWKKESGKDPTEIAQNDYEEYKRIFWKFR